MTLVLPIVSLQCLACEAVAVLSASANAIVEFTDIAAFLPAFLSSLPDLLDSITSEMILEQVEASCNGSNAAKSSTDVSTTAVAEGAGSGHSISMPAVFA